MLKIKIVIYYYKKKDVNLFEDFTIIITIIIPRLKRRDFEYLS